MATLTDFITNWGEVVELDFPKMDLNHVRNVCEMFFLLVHLWFNKKQGYKLKSTCKK